MANNIVISSKELSNDDNDILDLLQEAYEETGKYVASDATGRDYTYDELDSVFNMVKDPDDWKAPIAVTCAGAGVMPITAAITFFTGTTPTVKLDSRRMRYLVESVGYRNGPCGP